MSVPKNTVHLKATAEHNKGEVNDCYFYINTNNGRPNWEKIAFLIHDKRLGIVPPPIDPSMNFYNRISETQHTPSVTKEYADSFTETTSTTSTTNTSKKQIKLSEIDKIKILQMFEDLELDKMLEIIFRNYSGREDEGVCSWMQLRTVWILKVY